MALSLAKDYRNLPDILDKYENIYSRFEKDSNMDGKTMLEISKENPNNYAYFEERSIELKYLLDTLELRRTQLQGKLYQGIKKGSNISLNEREINQYVKSDDAYVDISIMILEVKELHDKFLAAVNTFKNIGYSMNNLTKLMIAQLEQVTL